MKRIISFLLCLACLCALALPVVAAPTDPMAVKFQKFLDRCDSLYDGDVLKLALTDAMKAFVPRDDLAEIEVSAADFETELEKQIVLTEAVLNDIRSAERGLYNPENNKYAVKYPGGVTDISDERYYRGYVKTGENTYAVYYQKAVREILDESAEVISQYKNPITGEVKYNGKVYVQDSGIYYRIKSWEEVGKKYTVELIDGKMRFVSGEDFVAEQLPTVFDDVSVTYDLPKDDTVYLDDVAYFPDQTVVKVERITGSDQQITQAMEKISTQYAPYVFTALQNGNPVQPSSKMKVHFVVPENFGANTVVMRMDATGELTELTAMEKNIEGTAYLVAELEHFGTYLLVDRDAKPVAPTTEPTIAPTAEPTTQPTTAATQATVGETKETTAATKETAAATQVTAATKETVVPTIKPTSVPVVRPTVPATEDPTEQTEADPTEETGIAPTEEVAPTDATAAAPTEEPKPAKSNKTGGIVAAVIVVIVLAGGGFAAWWFYFRKKNEQVETEEAEEEETEEKADE